MRRIAFYIAATGEIDTVTDYSDGTLDATITADQPAGCTWLEGDADPTTDYVLAGVITERPGFGAEELYHIDADGTEVTLFTMPTPTIVTFDGNDFTAGDPYFAVDDDPDGAVLGGDEGYLALGMGTTDFTIASTRNGEFVFSIQPDFPYQPVVVTVIAHAV
jgi:hypothetical protein